MERNENSELKWKPRRRSVSSILARQQAEEKKCRQLFPPDFAHGEVVVAELYDILGSKFAERVLFVVDDGKLRTVAYFDDYFLVVEQRVGRRDEAWARWWEDLCDRRSRLVVLDVGEGRKLGAEATIRIDVDRRRLRELEQEVLGVVRDGIVDGESPEEQRCRAEIDILSLVTLTSRLSEARVPAHSH